jgi:hypothetical protein
MAKQGFKIMDCDMHIQEPEDLWRRYLDERYRHRAPKYVPVDSTGRMALQCDGKVFPAFTGTIRCGAG